MTLVGRRRGRGLRDVHAEGPHERDGDADVGPLFSAVDLEGDGGFGVGRRHQEPLANWLLLAPRCAPFRPDAAAPYLQGNLPFAGVLDGGPELAHSFHQVGDGTLSHPGDAVHGVRAGAEGQRGRQEAGHRAGVAHEGPRRRRDARLPPVHLGFSPRGRR